MQLLGRLFDGVLKQRGQRVTVVGATSGDTGSAAIEAFRGLDAADVFILYPHGRVSEVQRRQMTTPPEPNVHALAVQGDFDDCQALVKGLFNDLAFRDEVRLAAVNSINWARVLAQVVYYVTAAVALGAPARAVSFSVPTGNFGDVFAGHVARRMGLPIEKLVIATNENDILYRMMQTGEYAKDRVVATIAPSMDIQVSSNFERLLFELYGRDGSAVRTDMDELKDRGRFRLGQGAVERLAGDFAVARSDRARTIRKIRQVREGGGPLIDPHSAIGLVAAEDCRGGHAVPMIALGTAHAAKFPDAVEEATGVRPALPPRMANLFDRKERMTVIENDLPALETLIRERRCP